MLFHHSYTSNFTFHFMYNHHNHNHNHMAHKAMDWFSWLSKTGLEPSLVHEYGLSFSQNELVEDDISYFNHELLQSMGISIAKHRLEILKLARKHRGPSRPRSMSRILNMIKRTQRCLAQYIQTRVHREHKALVLVPSRSYSSRWKGAMAERSNRWMLSKQGRLLLTNGSPHVNSFSIPVVHDLHSDERMDDDDDDEDDDDYETTGVEEISRSLRSKSAKPSFKFLGSYALIGLPSSYQPRFVSGEFKSNYSIGHFLAQSPHWTKKSNYAQNDARAVDNVLAVTKEFELMVCINLLEFWPKNLRSTYCTLKKFLKVARIGPPREFLANVSWTRLLKFPKLGGICPVKWLRLLKFPKLDKVAEIILFVVV